MAVNVGIHTVELSWELTVHPVLFRKLQQRLMRKGGKNWEGQYTGDGIARVSFVTAPEGRPYRALRLQVNPAVLFGNNRYSITPLDLVQNNLEALVNQWLESHYGCLPFKYPPAWKVYRLDVACDLPLEEGEPESYIQLAQQAPVPQGMQDQSNGHKLWNSYRIENLLETFQLYRKDLQLHEIGRDASEYENVLRIERQLKNGRINEVRKRFELRDKTLQELCRHDIIDTLLYERMATVFGELPSFVTTIEAEKRLLSDEGMPKSKRQKLTELLQDLSLEDGGLRALKNSGKMSSNTLRTRIAWMTDQGVSPLLLENGNKKVTLANPLSLIFWSWNDARAYAAEPDQRTDDTRSFQVASFGSSTDMLTETKEEEFSSTVPSEPIANRIWAVKLRFPSTCIWIYPGLRTVERHAQLPGDQSGINEVLKLQVVDPLEHRKMDRTVLMCGKRNKKKVVLPKCRSA